MYTKAQTNMPELFRRLRELGCLDETMVRGTSDGFCAAVISVADILARRDITVIPGEDGGFLECRLFFDDWYLYAVPDGTEPAYSLFKMREQEHDAKMGLHADGDTPGVTVSFIALQEEILLECLTDPTPQNGRRLDEEINRVVARRGQRHSDALKRYFVRAEAQGPYLIAELYTSYIASLAQNGCLPVPELYASEHGNRGLRGRLPRFIEENNREAGRVVCDHESIFIRDPACPSIYERMAILATHAGNVSVFSFAAEVQFHAWFLTWWAKIPLPVIGRSPYESAIRADMSIGDAELTGPTPYYRLNSRLVKKQYLCHKGAVSE